ncbi:unnamed protein product, partial [Sphacelaria rigidula]
QNRAVGRWRVEQGTAARQHRNVLPQKQSPCSKNRSVMWKSQRCTKNMPKMFHAFQFSGVPPAVMSLWHLSYFAPWHIGNATRGTSNIPHTHVLHRRFRRRPLPEFPYVRMTSDHTRDVLYTATISILYVVIQEPLLA